MPQILVSHSIEATPPHSGQLTSSQNFFLVLLTHLPPPPLRSTSPHEDSGGSAFREVLALEKKKTLDDHPSATSGGSPLT